MADQAVEETINGRRVINVKVPVKLKLKTGQEITKWLQEDGTLSEDEASAIKFRLYVSTTPAETDRIEELEHNYRGFDWYLGLHEGIDNARTALKARLESDLWPDGRPKAEGKAWIEQDKQLGKALDDDESKAKAGFESLVHMSERINFYARWEVLGVDIPSEWRDLKNKEMDGLVFVSIWNAFVAALGDHILGKTEPSKS